VPNTDNPHGLRPLGWCLGGGPPVIQKMKKDASEGTAIFAYDAVNREADGNIEAASATPGTTLYSGVSLNHGAASTLTDHLVIVSPDCVYEAQDNDDTNGLEEADMGLNINLELNAGNATTKQSGHELDESTVDTTNTLDMHLLQLLEVPDNAYGEHARIEIVFNKHRMNPGVAGV
jgi:hypothetical protein